MTTEEDNFDIDIYGDGGGEDYDEGSHAEGTTNQESHTETAAAETGHAAASHSKENVQEDPIFSTEQNDSTYENSSRNTSDQVYEEHAGIERSSAKRKDGSDERSVDPGATGALFISDLPWWITDDDIRGWANQSGCEDELEEITFSEHKVNGKSKGQAYALLTTPQAATATKHLMDAFGSEGNKYKQKFACNYTNPLVNPFKTLPKDGNTRSTGPGTRTTSGGFNSVSGQQSGPGQGGFRGRGGYNNRGSMGGYNRGGYNQSMSGGYQGGGMNNFQGGMQQYGGFQNRGGMMGGMRGGNMSTRGRGGMGNMMNMPMGGMMGMGAMSGQMPNMGMGMPGMNANMGMQGTGFQNPSFFPQQTDNWNPHGAKRTRQE